MKLIADSGSTKTDWVVIDKNGELERFTTVGMNPIMLGREKFSDLIICELQPRLSAVSKIKEIYFYGAGCTPEQSVIVRDVFASHFTSADTIVVDSDLMGAAIALCGKNKGVACILGTGSNSCLYDGEKIIQNTPALGYILGDEGSGAVLGRRFLNALLKGILPEAIKEEFLKEYSLTLACIINKVYREPMANRFLASVSPFVYKHIDNQQVAGLVVSVFCEFLRVNVRPYYVNPSIVGHESQLVVNFVGSMAHYYEPQLRKAAELENVKIGIILKSPIDGLKKYYS